MKKLLKTSGWLCGAGLYLFPLAVWGQSAPGEPLPNTPQTETVSPEEEAELLEAGAERPEDESLESEDELSESAEESTWDSWETPWDLTTLADGRYVVSSVRDPHAEAGVFAFFDQEAEQLWGFRYAPTRGMLGCFEGERTALARLTNATTASYIDEAGWYFNTADFDFGLYPFRLTEFPEVMPEEEISEKLEICRQVLLGIDTAMPDLPQGPLILGAFSYLPLNPNRVLPDGSVYNVHEFSGQAGQEINILMTSSDFDAYLVLQGVDGQTIIENDDSGGGRNALLEIVLPRTGAYRVLANTYEAGSAGEYLLTVTVDEPDSISTENETNIP
ncbi:MAG: PPC domain-containing protein [Cyanobacteria bacterium P01_F01_bin.56]